MPHAVNRFVGALACLVVVHALAGCGPASSPKGTTTPSGAAGTSAQAGTGGGSTGAAGTSAAAGPAGTGGGNPAPADASTSGAAGTTPSMNADAAMAGTSGSGATDAAAPAPDGTSGAGGAAGTALPKLALLFTASASGYRHESIEPAAAAIKAALTPLGISSEISADLTLFTPTGLARFGVVVLISTSGAVFGTPGTDAQNALVGFVRAGGGVVSIHAATASGYDGTTPYIKLLGGKFIDHPGGIRDAPCFVEGAAHVTTATMPAMFMWRDEIYTFRDLAPDNQVVVTCTGYNSTMHIPISWHRLEGAGRVFNTAMGHGIELYAATGILVKDHLVPGILWTLKLK